MPDSLQFSIVNHTNSSGVYAYVVGLAIQHNWQRCLIKSNGRDLYFPTEPPAIGSPLLEDCAIPLGPPGNTITITVPQLAGGRLWFSRDAKLTFLLNPGPALVEPSVLNPTDPNANVDFAFCEFTLNEWQFYGNISYVDFVPRLPIGISLTNKDGHVQTVTGMAADGIDRIAGGLREQATRDGKPWDKLIVECDGRPFRVLNATHGAAVGADFCGYFEPHIEEVWQHLRHNCCRINTQAAPGVVEGYINDKDELVIGGEVFSKPNTADVLGCNSGPFTTGPNATRNAIIPRLAAGFVRSTFLDCGEHPSHCSTYYRRDPTNHYARVVHECNVDGKGYAFAYDDVQPDEGDDQSGKVNDGAPVLFTAVVGGHGQGPGGNAHEINRPVPSENHNTGRPPPPPIPPKPNPNQPPPIPPRPNEGDQRRHGGIRGKLQGLKDKLGMK